MSCCTAAGSDVRFSCDLKWGDRGYLREGSQVDIFLRNGSPVDIEKGTNDHGELYEYRELYTCAWTEFVGLLRGGINVRCGTEDGCGFFCNLY